MASNESVTLIEDDQSNTADLSKMNKFSAISESAQKAAEDLRSSLTRAESSTPQARVVSIHSLSQVSLSSSSLPLKKRALPFESLIELARTKQNISPTGCKKATIPHVASVFGEPSDAFMSILARACEPATKKLKETEEGTSPAPDALHEACRRGPTLAELDEILRKDPKAASRAIRLTTKKKIYSIQKGCIEEKDVPELYRYPLNIAIAHRASEEVIERLATSAPEILTHLDGPATGKEDHSNLTSLHILLRHQPNATASVDMILLKQPNAASLSDGHGNTPLHTAVLKGASIKTIHHLNLFSPEHITRRNGNGCTPLQLAQSLSFCSQRVVSYLWKELDSRF